METLIFFLKILLLSQTSSSFTKVRKSPASDILAYFLKDGASIHHADQCYRNVLLYRITVNKTEEKCFSIRTLLFAKDLFINRSIG